MVTTSIFKSARPVETAPFRRYIVVDVLSTAFLEKEKLKEYSEKIVNLDHFCQKRNPDTENEELFLIAPRNSVIAQLVGFGGGKIPDRYYIMYPFFSSHMCLPVKPGEYVWGMSEPADPTDRIFWLSRIHEPDFVEDLNYTHGDRRLLPTASKISGYELDSSGKKNVFSPTPRFPNGDFIGNRESDDIDPSSSDVEKLHEKGVDESEFTLSELDDYEKIVEGATVKSQIFYEPVPRFSKRPGDLSFHGSNNASIVLGTERGYAGSSQIKPDKNSSFPENDEAQARGVDEFALTEGNGAIDIVVGRGRYPEGASSAADQEPSRTQARVIKNARDNFETNKNPGLDESKAPKGSAAADLAEGDPDFHEDAARVYVSMKSSPDALFDLSYPALNGEVEVEPISDKSAVVIKSDQTRIIARKDGAIRIIKEGEPGLEKSTIVLEADGTIMIDGPRIIIGSGAERDNGAGDQVFVGRDATESIVLGNQLNTTLKEFMEDVILFITETFPRHGHATGAGPSGPAGTGTDNPSTQQNVQTHGTDMQAMVDRLNLHLSKVGKTK